MPSTLQDNSDLSQHQRAKPDTGSTEGLRAHQHPHAVTAGRVFRRQERVCALHVGFAPPSRAQACGGEACVCQQGGRCRPAARAAADGLCLPAPQRLRHPRGAGGGGAGRGGVVKNRLRFSREGTWSHSWHISSSSCHAACKTILSEEGAGSWSPGGLRGGAAGRRWGQTGRSTALSPLALTPAGTPPVHTSKHGPRDGEAPAWPLGQGLFVVGSGSHCFWLQTPKLTKFWEILSSAPCVGQLSRHGFGASSTQTLHSGKHAC